MKLQDSLPDSVIVNGKRVRLDLDFRKVLRMIETLERSDLMPEARDYLAIRCICRHPKPGTLDAVKKLLFTHKRNADGKKLTSFEQDASLIRAAFRQTYGIDLYRDRLHWIEFTELLQGIPEGTRFAETVSIRAREMPSPTKYNAKEREWLAKAKSAVALEIPEEERMKNYNRDVLNIFAALEARAKEVKRDA